jgi:4-hydroxythreonine-4-phosphate dehydrogenase
MTDAPLPRLALTMGDPAGIGPEILLRALTDPGIRRLCRPTAVGSLPILRDTAMRLAIPLEIVAADTPGDETSRPGSVTVVDPCPPGGAPIPPGVDSAAGGAAALACIERATAYALEGLVDGIVTAPISKAAIHLAGSPFPGHTEMLASLTGASSVVMMLAGGGLRVSLATIHIPLATVPEALARVDLPGIIRLTAAAVARMGFPSPRLAVCGLNPHAGEGGLFGLEEERIIAPAIRLAVAEGIDAVGPLPADTVFHRALKGDFHGVVAMYHDQGLGPLKTVAFDRGVNITLGLPIVRTSPDHGTAFDIAGKGVADPASMLEAVRTAAAMAAAGQG